MIDTSSTLFFTEEVHLSFPHESDPIMIMVRTTPGSFVGTVTIKPPREGDVLDFVRLYVAPSWRNQGVGRILINAVLEYARANNHQTIACMVHERNDGGFAFYRRLGFFEACRLNDGMVVMVRRVEALRKMAEKAITIIEAVNQLGDDWFSIEHIYEKTGSDDPHQKFTIACLVEEGLLDIRDDGIVKDGVCIERFRLVGGEKVKATL